jgi:hypothetical protein
MDYFQSGMQSDGLYRTPPLFNWHPYDVAEGEDSHTNAAIYRALLDLAQLEGHIGSTKGATEYERRAARIKKAMLDHLWDPVAGAFLLNSDDPLRNHSQDAQVEAIYDGLIGGRQARNALRFIDANLWTAYGTKNGEYDADPFMSNYISPYISSTELLARLKVGDTTGALDLLRRLWGHIVSTDPKSTVWEKMSIGGDVASYTPDQIAAGLVPDQVISAGRGSTSLAHSWSSGPAQALSAYVLGVRPVSPGFREWEVEPQVGDLRFAQGQVPTPYGSIVSRWKRGQDHRSFVFTVSAPTDTRGTVAVPLLGGTRAIWMDGRLVWHDGQAGAGISAAVQSGYLRVRNVSGTHTFAWGVGAETHAASTRMFVNRMAVSLGSGIGGVRAPTLGMLGLVCVLAVGLRWVERDPERGHSTTRTW